MKVLKLNQLTGYLEEVEITSNEGVPLFVQDNAPVTESATYMWVQTNYLEPGGITFWVEDGT